MICKASVLLFFLPFHHKISFSVFSEHSSPAHPSFWVHVPWSSPSSLLSSFQRNPRVRPLPPSYPLMTSPSQTAKSQCLRWLASTSIHPSPAAMRRALPPPTMRTLSLCCMTVLFDGPQRAGLTPWFD